MRWAVTGSDRGKEGRPPAQGGRAFRKQRGELHQEAGGVLSQLVAFLALGRSSDS